MKRRQTDASLYRLDRKKMNSRLHRFINYLALAWVLCLTPMPNVALAEPLSCDREKLDAYIMNAEQNINNMMELRFSDENHPGALLINAAVDEMGAFINQLKIDLKKEPGPFYFYPEKDNEEPLTDVGRRKKACIVIASSRARAIFEYASKLDDYSYRYPLFAKENIEGAKQCMGFVNPKSYDETKSFYLCKGEETPAD